ncbi:MAG: porin family protein [Acidobacteria bacterium]|nr:porin family protein [Acidobacteriota bacterium]
MKRFVFAFFCVAVLSSVGIAQSDKKGDFFIGYSNLQAEGIPNRDNPSSVFDKNFFDRRAGLHGVNVSATGYFFKYFGITGDFSFHRDKNTDDFGSSGSDRLDTQVYYFMVGPKLKFRNPSRLEPYVHALAGGAHTRFKVNSTVNTSGGTFNNSFTTSATDFAVAVGGGLDVRLSDNFSLRLIQVDYAPIFLKDRSIQTLGGSGAIVPFTLEGQRQDNIRISVGLVF